MKRSYVLFAILAAGCAKAPENALPTPEVVVNVPPPAVADAGSAADGALVVLRLPGMV